jgi:hypothetical protein
MVRMGSCRSATSYAPTVAGKSSENILLKDYNTQIRLKVWFYSIFLNVMSDVCLNASVVKWLESMTSNQVPLWHGFDPREMLW